jgi:hypothetical protein
MGQKGGSENADMSAALITSTNSRTAEYDAGTAMLNSGKGWDAIANGWNSVAQAGKGWSDAVSHVDSTKYEGLTLEDLKAKYAKPKT